MTKVRETGVIPAPIADVWAVVGDFGGIAQWLPPLAKSSLEPGSTGDNVGDVRQVTIEGGPTFAEVQTARSDAAHTLTYTVPESPMPMRGYESTIELSDKGENTAIAWSCTFELDSGQEGELVDEVSSIYRAGIDSLRLGLGG